MTDHDQAAPKVQRRPLAWGMQEWGPLPGSAVTVIWDGPGSGLFIAGGPRRLMRRIRHPAASGTYATVKAASAAVAAFVAASPDHRED